MNSPDQRLRRRFESMPQVPPPAALMPRVLRARQRRLRGSALVTGAVAVLALAVALLPRLVPADDVQPHAGPVATTPHALDADLLEQVRALDRALQAGYDQGASEDELAPLWDARHQLLPAPTAAPHDSRES